MFLDFLQLLILVGLAILMGYYWRPSIKFIATGIVIGKIIILSISRIIDTIAEARIVWPFQEMVRDTRIGDLNYYPLIMMCLAFGLLTGVIGSAVEYLLTNYKTIRLFRSARSRRASR